MIIKDEEINYEAIEEIFRDLNYCYVTSNKKKLEELIVSLLNNYKIVIENHKTRLQLLEFNYKRCIDTIQKVKNILE